MKVLFIGGNGNISWYCVQYAIDAGYEVWELNRSATLKTRRTIQPEVKKITCDIHDIDSLKKILANEYFDCVCDFICFNDVQAKEIYNIFNHRTNQFIYISSESVYKRKSEFLPFKETTEQYDPQQVCPYISGKILAEQFFKNVYESDNFPVTIVRPAYTYDVIVPTSIGQNCFTATNRILNGFPLLIAGDGTNLCTFTHSSDFASAFIKLIGNSNSIGEDFHITSDEWLTWNEQSNLFLKALDYKSCSIIHIPYSDAINLDFFEKDIMYQKMWHNIYDNSKIRKIIPDWHAKIKFKDGIKKTLNWLECDSVRRRINPKFDLLFDDLYKKYWR